MSLSGLFALASCHSARQRCAKKSRFEELNSTEEDADEIHDQLVGAAARFADGIRECPEADTGSVPSMEGAWQFQDRVVRYPSGGLGWVYDVGLRRSVGGSQVLFDVACF